jgi:hypothetical protein
VKAVTKLYKCHKGKKSYGRLSLFRLLKLNTVHTELLSRLNSFAIVSVIIELYKFKCSLQATIYVAAARRLKNNFLKKSLLTFYGTNI